MRIFVYRPQRSVIVRLEGALNFYTRNSIGPGKKPITKIKAHRKNFGCRVDLWRLRQHTPRSDRPRSTQTVEKGFALSKDFKLVQAMLVYRGWYMLAVTIAC